MLKVLRKALSKVCGILLDVILLFMRERGNDK